jgi:ATP-binding cassette subfamily F protein 3
LNALVNRVVEVDHGQLREYPGNYDDYLRKKTSSAQTEPAAVKLEPPQTPTQQAAPQSAAPLSKQDRIAARERERELTRRHKRATKRLAAVEEEIRESEGRLEQIAWRLGDPEVHRNPDAIREVEAERDEIRSRVDELYREWERLAAEVESGEQGMGG